MTPAPTRSFLDLPLGDKRAVDRVCLEFERAGPAARVEDYIAGVPPHLRGPLLAELVALDADRRKRAGETPSADDYLARLPDLTPELRAAVRTAVGPAVGDALGRYRLTGVLGRGGMGVVYEAEDPVVGRRVAIKVLPERLLADPRARDRMLHEARAGGQLLHQNVVTLFEVGEADGVLFLVLERVAGGSAADRLAAAGPFPWRDAARVAVDVCRGLAAIHAAGFLHLDVKPSNVLLPGDATGVAAKLTDFSLAVAGDAIDAGVSAGTPAYMSPEQRGGDAVSPRTDVYGLGATLFALLTGKPPFPGADVTTIAAAQVRTPVPDPRALNPGVPEPVAAVVRRAMAPDPADRHPSADAVLLDLQRVLGGRPRRGWAAVGVAAGLAAVTAMAVGLGPGRTGDDAASLSVADEAGRPLPRIDTWEQMFDGHTLAGWHPVPFEGRADVGPGFEAVEVDGGPVLRAAGAGLTAIETDREYENFHMRFEYRWGAAAGLHQASIRYHCTGPVGAKGTHGMELHMRQAGSYIRRNDLLKLDLGEVRGGEVVPVGPAGQTIAPHGGKEAPLGRWNRAALVCVGDWSVHVVNGTPVLALARSRKPGDDGEAPLTRGRIRLQSGTGEVFFRKVEIRRATEIPPEYRQGPPLGGK